MSRKTTMNRLFLLLTTLVLTASMSPAQPQQDNGAKRIEIVAHRYTYKPDEITLTKGQLVTLVLNSEDVTHGLLIPELGIKAEIHKGQPTEINITPEQAGTFQGQCAYFCGPGHGNMKLTVHVKE
jgi:cytochrome c oxidase subunit 2